MGEIMNSPEGVKSCVPERVSISCPTCGTRHDLHQITGNQPFVTVSEQTIQHMSHRGIKFVSKLVYDDLEFPKSSLREEYPCFNNFGTKINLI